MDTANDFLAAARALNLSVQAQDAAFARIRALGLSPDDPATIHVVVGAALEAQAGVLLAQIEAAPSTLKRAATEAVEPVAKAAVERARVDLNKLGHSVVRKMAASLQSEAEKSFDALQKSVRVRVGASLAFTLFVVTALAFGAGVWLGSRQAANFERTWESLAARSGAATWVALIENNIDIDAAIRGTCGPGMPAQVVQDGSRACQVPLWLDLPAAPSLPSALATGWSGALAWFNQWPAHVLLLSGLVSGLLLRRAAKLIGRVWPVLAP